MADLKDMIEKITVHSVSAKLLENGIITALPDVDLEGADLLAIMKIEDGARFARIQCKGRTLKKSNNVTIKKRYVTGTFTCILNVKYLHNQTDHLFCFFAHDIKTRPDLWKEVKEDYKLTLYCNTFQSKLDLFYLTESRINALKKMIKESDQNKEFYNFFGKMEATMPSDY